MRRIGYIWPIPQSLLNLAVLVIIQAVRILEESDDAEVVTFTESRRTVKHSLVASISKT